MKRKVGVFNNSDDAIAAIRRLQNMGFTNEEISVVSHDPAMADFTEGENLIDETGATAAGAVTGGLVGGLGALLIELGLIAIPGIGPFLAVGPVGAALVGALTGGAVGGLVGALIDMGFEEDEAKLYHDRVQEGKILVIVDDHVDRNADIDAIFNPTPSSILNESGEEGFTDRTEHSADYLAATRRDYMGGGAAVNPDYNQFESTNDYQEAKRHDYMPIDRTEHGTEDVAVTDKPDAEIQTAYASPEQHSEDYLAATRRDHMGGGGRVNPNFDKFEASDAYEEAKKRDYMPVDRTEHGNLEDWFRRRWQETKHDLKNRWDKLTDQDIDSIGGDRELLRTTLKTNYNLSDNEVDTEIDDYFGPRDYLGNAEEEKSFDDYLRDQWDTAKDEIQQQWEKLTNDHVDTIRGDRGRLRSSLSEAYGWTEDEANRHIGNYYSQRDYSTQAHHRFEEDIESERIIDHLREDEPVDFDDGFLAGQWDQLKGQVQRQWGKLTNDDLDVIRGDRNILKGKLKEYYGYDDDEVERQVSDHFKTL